MKGFLTMCTLAVALMAAAEQKASAWSKFGFSVGLNVNLESADNSYLWGAYRKGPHPFAQSGGYGYGSDYPVSESMPYAAAPAQQPMLPAPRPYPMENQGVAPASYWSQSYYWMGN